MSPLANRDRFQGCKPRIYIYSIYIFDIKLKYIYIYKYIYLYICKFNIFLIRTLSSLPNVPKLSNHINIFSAAIPAYIPSCTAGIIESAHIADKWEKILRIVPPPQSLYMPYNLITIFQHKSNSVRGRGGGDDSCGRILDFCFSTIRIVQGNLSSNLSSMCNNDSDWNPVIGHQLIFR